MNAQTQLWKTMCLLTLIGSINLNPFTSASFLSITKILKELAFRSLAANVHYPINNDNYRQGSCDRRSEANSATTKVQ